MSRRLFVFMTPAILAIGAVMPSVGVMGWEYL